MIPPRYSPRPVHFAFGLAAVALGAGVLAEDGFHRAQQPEVFGSGMWANGQSTVMQADGIPFNVNFGDEWGGGVGGGYNLDDHWNFNVNWNMGAAETEVTAMGNTVESTALAYSIQLGADYNILRSRFTPLLCANFGFAWFDDDVFVPAGSSRYDVTLSYTQPTFQAGGGAGVRWDFNDHLFLKAVYRLMWNTGLDAIEDDMVFQSATIIFGYRF